MPTLIVRDYLDRDSRQTGVENRGARAASGATGTRAYAEVLQAMQSFTRGRDASTTDEIWLLEHGIYTGAG